MNPITDIWRQLMRRRLWPVALLLVGALAAVPFFLAKEPEATEPTTSPAAAGAVTKAALATQPIVAQADPADPSKDRKPLGAKHDIFKPTKKAPKVVPVEAAKVAAPEEATPKADAGGGSGSSGGAGTTPTAPATEPEKPKTYPLYSLIVRFDGAKRTLPSRTALPSAEEPLIIYLGLTDRNKTAVFMVDSTLTPQGDGECHPTPQNCETVHLQEGDTEFFDIADENGEGTGSGFQLDLVTINKGKTTDADRAARSSKLAKVSRAATLGRTLAAGFGDATRRLGVVGRTG